MRLASLGLLAILLSATCVFGDGCYIPERAVRKIPEIPSQRAVLSWRNGVETLVISSSLDSESQKLGWIIPLPAVPDSIEKQTPGALKTLNFCIQPKITHDLSEEVRFIIGAAVLGNLLMATFLFKRKWLMEVIILVLLVIILKSLSLSASGTLQATIGKDGLLVEKSVTVGSYEIKILRPSKPEDLNSWLGDNGFVSLPSAADSTIVDYLSKDWVFAAIKLTRAESGTNAPHPIKIVFPAKEAVYPMKLTSIAGNSTNLELFVIADHTAAYDTLHEEFCDRFVKVENSLGYEDDEVENKTSFLGEKSHCSIGHPSIQPLLWEGCVLTKFAGTMSAKEMTNDIHFKWKPFRGFQQHFYTPKGARGYFLILFLSLVGIWGIVSMLLWRNRIVQPQGFRRYFGRLLLPGVSLFAVVGWIAFALLPKLEASEVQISDGRNRFPLSLCRTVEHLLNEHSDVLQNTEQEIADYLIDTIQSNETNAILKNGLTGTELLQEDSPGNFTVEKLAEKVMVRVFERDGSVRILNFPLYADKEDMPDVRNTP